MAGITLDDAQARIQKSYLLAADARRVAQETRRLLEEAQQSLGSAKRPVAIVAPLTDGRPAT